ncbi:hypothetical protein [Parabacteroides sp.]
MTIQEIFNLPIIKEIEEEILNTQWTIDFRKGCYETQKELIKRLIELRKQLLENEFVMNEYYKRLLSEFNEAMRDQLIKMRLETIKAYKAAEIAGLIGQIEAIGKCFMGYRYSIIHPIQTIRAKKMWAVLNGTLDDYVSLYWDGVTTDGWSYKGGEPESENMLLYLSEKTDNWNEGLDYEWTKDMQLIHAVHNLYSHTSFSIFDLLWVRNFNMEIFVATNYNTYKGDYNDNLDWSKYDY